MRPDATPAVMRGCLRGLPWVEDWQDAGFWQAFAARLVPVEDGSYLDDKFSQRIVAPPAPANPRPSRKALRAPGRV